MGRGADRVGRSGQTAGRAQGLTGRSPIPRLELPAEYDEFEVGGDARALYTRLAADGPLDLDDLDSSIVRRLGAAGLVTVADGQVDAVAPGGPLLSLVDRHTQQAVAAREALDDLMTVWRTARTSEVGVEVHSGASADRAYRQGILSAEREIVALSIGPRAGMEIEPAPGLLEALARGVTVRVIYHNRVFESASALEVTEACIAAGEEARVFPGVPVNLVIMDDFATMNASYDSDEPIHLACTRNRRIVNSWKAIFESFWRLAIPFDSGDGLAQGTAEFRELARLLGLGLTDRAIARELGVSERTVGRRVTRLQDHLGAETRFQLGLQIAVRGWL